MKKRTAIAFCLIMLNVILFTGIANECDTDARLDRIEQHLNIEQEDK